MLSHTLDVHMDSVKRSQEAPFFDLAVVLLGVVARIVGAANLGLGGQNSAHDVALVLPHLLELLRRVHLEGLHDILDQLVDIKALWAAHRGTAPLAHGHGQRAEERCSGPISTR